MVYRRYKHDIRFKNHKGGWPRRVQNLNVNGGGGEDWVKIYNNRLISLISKELRINNPITKMSKVQEQAISLSKNVQLTN